MKKILCAVLTVAMLMGMIASFPLSAVTKTSDYSWYTAEGGTKDSPYQISNAAQWNAFSRLSNGLQTESETSITGTVNFDGKYVELTGDVDLTDYDFVSIGGDATLYLEGNGHTVSNATTTMFTHLGANSSVSNLIFEDVQIQSAEAAAVLAVTATGGLSCYNIRVKDSCSVTSDKYAAGLVATISGNDSDEAVSLEYCINEADITGKNNVGGLVAYLLECDLDVFRCVNKGTLTSGSTTNYACVGGLIARFTPLPYALFFQCYNTGDLHINADAPNYTYLGGIVGQGSSGSQSNIYSCYDYSARSYPTDTGTSYNGGIVGSGGGYIDIEYCYAANKTTSGQPYTAIGSGRNLGLYQSTVVESVTDEIRDLYSGGYATLQAVMNQIDAIIAHMCDGAPHVYTNNAPCATQCNGCYEVREDALPHTYTNNADCDTGCDLCGETRSSAASHQWNAGEIVTTPTHSKIYTCLACEKTETAAIPQTLNGVWNETVTWSLDVETDTLTISGSGEIPNNAVIRNIGIRSAFLVKAVIIEDGITRIGRSAFAGCTRLENISISSSVTSIGSYAFDGTAYYNNSENWEDGLLYCGAFLIGSDAKYRNSIIIKEGTEVIGDELFFDTHKIVIPPSVKHCGPIYVEQYRGTVFNHATSLEIYVDMIIEEYFSADGESISSNALEFDWSVDTHALEYGEWEESSNTLHVKSCRECGYMSVTAEHVFDDEKDQSCNDCEYRRDIITPAVGMEWTYSDRISFSYKFYADAPPNASYTDPKVVFTIGDRTVSMTEYTLREGVYQTYVFTLDIAPHEIGNDITIVFYAMKGDVPVQSKPITYNIRRMLYDKLQNHYPYEPSDTVIVDLLNYGAATQTYVGDTDPLINAYLTDEQKALGTQEDVALSNYANSKYETVENASATWVGAYLTLIDNVEMKFVFNAENTDGLTVKVTTADPKDPNAVGTTWTITNFTPYADGGYVAAFDGFNATQMRELVYVTVYDAEGNAISNTYRYSIESYACAKANGSDANLAALVMAMMTYGDSAANVLNS